MNTKQTLRARYRDAIAATIAVAAGLMWVLLVIILGAEILRREDSLTTGEVILLCLVALCVFIPIWVLQIKSRRSANLRRDPALYLRTTLANAGWFPGRQTDAEVSKLHFQMHAPGIRFMTEFGGLFLGNVIHVTARDANYSYKYRDRISAANLPNCLPVAMSWYWCEGELWMDELGRIYQADDNQLALVSDTVGEALEILIVRQKEIPADFPRWDIEPRKQNPHDLGAQG